MNVWSGSISLDAGRGLEGISLIDQTTHWQCDISKDAKLALRSFVNPALIPLHARAGPNLELHTSSPATTQWLRSKLMGAIWLEEDELDLHQSLQCPVGLLVSVDSSTSKKTTDVLIYGVLSNAASGSRPPTPPHSSPTEMASRPNNTTKPYELRIYGAPLSTLSVTQAQSLPSPPASADGEPCSTQAEFIPDASSPSPKRKRVATLFESAAQHHRRVRQRGGEGVSQLMAPVRPQSSSQNLQSLFVKREPEDDLPKNLDRIVTHRSRSMSIGANLQRPGSNRGVRATPGLNMDPRKRTQTPNAPLEPSFHHGSLAPQQVSVKSADKDDNNTPDSPPKSPEAIIAQNKDLITRTTLTCMRLYGFHRSNPRGKPTGGTNDPDAEAPNATPTAETRAETPARGMYHATYKAACFALRKYLGDPTGGSNPTPTLIEKEKAMTCIDGLLRVFCEDY
ncbi:hypothetical protein N7470_007689 [Penicillium chermesinum]|nr:hypothetical protein N7470_007689 [Penicillium chermesinum]